jgi:hypothetical protein
MSYLIAVPHRNQVLELDWHHVARLAELRNANDLGPVVPGRVPVRCAAGIILASPPLDFHVTDSHFAVAHFH